jgi:hypothetical protein
MKLLYCRECKDLLKILRSKESCDCGKCEAWFTGKKFFVRGPGVVLCPSNASIKKALDEFDKTGSSRAIETLILPAKAIGVVHLSSKKRE